MAFSPDTSGTVKLSGLRDAKRTVEIVMVILQKYLDQIPEDSKAAISAANLLGDKYINITRGTHPKHVEPDGCIESLETQVHPLKSLPRARPSAPSSSKTIVGRVDGLSLSIVEKWPGESSAS